MQAQTGRRLSLPMDKISVTVSVRNVCNASLHWFRLYLDDTDTYMVPLQQQACDPCQI